MFDHSKLDFVTNIEINKIILAKILFKFRFTPCSYANGMNTCFAPISIKFTDQVQTALESLNVSQVSYTYSYGAEGGVSTLVYLMGLNTILLTIDPLTNLLPKTAKVAKVKKPHSLKFTTTNKHVTGLKKEL